MQSLSIRSSFAGMAGNVLEHYDNALFGLLAPFISPLFFQNQDPVTALILTYAILPLGILMRPLGSLFFGWIGDQFGRRNSLFFSLVTMALTTVLIGCLPTYSQIGIWAPLLLALGKMVQNFCAAGESTGGAIFVLENTPLHRRNVMSGIYDASSIGGILIASALVAILSYQGCIEHGWRVLFWLGGLTAFVGVFLRFKSQDGKEFSGTSQAKEKKNPWKMIFQHKRQILHIAIVSGFSYTTYALAFTFMNGFVPLVTTLEKAQVMQINTLLLLLDMLLLPLFGYLAMKIGKEKLMFFAALLSALCAVPLFYLFPNACLSTVIFIRLVIMVLGIAFAASYHAWSLEQVLPQHRYTILSMGCALGSQLFGAPSAFVSLWLYQQLHSIAAPALYLMLNAAGACWVIKQSMSQKQLRPHLQAAIVDSGSACGARLGHNHGYK